MQMGNKNDIHTLQMINTVNNHACVLVCVCTTCFQLCKKILKTEKSATN